MWGTVIVDTRGRSEQFILLFFNKILFCCIFCRCSLSQSNRWQLSKMAVFWAVVPWSLLEPERQQYLYYAVITLNRTKEMFPFCDASTEHVHYSEFKKINILLYYSPAFLNNFQIVLYQHNSTFVYLLILFRILEFIILLLYLHFFYFVLLCSLTV